MGLISSTAGGLAITGWRGVIVAAVFACLFPSVLGAAVVGVIILTGTENMGDARMTTYALGALAMISPMLTWVAFGLSVPVVAWLLKRGWFGWLPAMGLGLVFGVAMGLVAENSLATVLGLLGIGLLRWVLGRLHPAAFTG